jgi:hypothetical protein
MPLPINGEVAGAPTASRKRRIVARAVTVLLLLTAINLLMVLLTGGYRVNLGFVRIAARHLDGPLLLFLIVAMATTWLHGKRRAIPAPIRLRDPLLLYLAVVFLYSLNGRALTAGDTIPASYLPLSLVREFDFDLDEFPFLYAGEMPWFVQRINGRIVSAYPPWAGLMAVPVYLLPVFGGLSPQSAWIHDLEKLSATLITGLSVVLLLFTLRRLTTENIAWCVALVYAFGTSSFSSSSQALWQHGPSQLFLTLTIYWLVRGIDAPRFSAYAGLALASAVICRPTNALMVVPIVAYIIWHRRAYVLGFLLTAAPPALFLIAYNLHYFGSPFTTGFVGTTGPSRLWSSASYLFSTPLPTGLAGVLGSPGRGLFVYSPIFIVAVVGIGMVWGNPKAVLLKYLSVAPVLIILLAAKWLNWWGGGSYGPRLLADITPLMCLYLYPPFERARSQPFLKYAFICLAILSIGLHALRVFASGDWNGHPNVDWHPERLWSWGDSPPMYYGQNLVRQAYAELNRFTTGLPTSRDAPDQLAASYHLRGMIPEGSLSPGAFLICRVQVVNEGKAVWLAHAKWEKGEVRLRWRWFTGDREIASMSGGWLIGYDVLPAQTYEFTLEIPTPREPGEYALELGLVSMQVTSFAEQGSRPLTIPVQVTDALGGR